MQKASSCRFLKCHADMAFPDEVVAAHDPGAEPRPFSSREDLAALLAA